MNILDEDLRPHSQGSTSVNNSQHEEAEKNITMKRVLLSLITGLVLATGANALPPRQHFIDGTIASIDREKIALVATTGKPDSPTLFVVERGRTRFREQWTKSSAELLKVGQMVRIYYKRENGVWVATGVSWKAPSTL